MLRRDLERLSEEAEVELVERYALRFPPRERMTLYRRCRIALGRELRRLGLRRTRPPEPWLAGLKHGAGNEHARPMLIWAVGCDRETLRAACEGFATVCSGMPEVVPVLVTDVADFAFFSRLGWLVEYVPALCTPSERYAERKRRYLAWRYREAKALPVSAGFAGSVRIRDLLID